MEKTILVVEDDVDLIGIYKEILELHEYDVQTALNGKEGVEKFKELEPALVIMDGDMPVLDGYEAFKQIKANFQKQLRYHLTTMVYSETWIV